MRGSGGTEGGSIKYVFGFLLVLISVYLFFDSVKITTVGQGWISGNRMQAAHWETTSMGLIFVPFFISILILFYDASKRWAWWLLYIGLGLIFVEILSRIRFLLHMKTTHLMGIFVMFAAGLAVMLQSYKATKEK
jgi:hypothetical protein